MTDKEQPQPERRPTPTDRVWESLNALIMKPPQRGSESVEFNRVTTGDLKGTTAPKVVCVRGENEKWDDFRARYQRQVLDVDNDAIALDESRIRRQLEASTGPKAVG